MCARAHNAQHSNRGFELNRPARAMCYQAIWGFPVAPNGFDR